MCWNRTEGLRMVRLGFHASLYNQRVQLEPKFGVHSPSQSLYYFVSLAEPTLVTTTFIYA